MLAQQVRRDHVFSYSECAECKNDVPLVYHGEGRCVFKFDHYCNWCANAIGCCNRFYFITFLALQTSSSLGCVASGLRCIHRLLGKARISIYDVLDCLTLVFANAVALVTSAITLANNLIYLMKGHSLRSYGIYKSVVKLIQSDQLRVAQSTADGTCILVSAPRCEQIERDNDESYAICNKAESIRAAKLNAPYSTGVRGIAQAFRERKFCVR